MEEKNAEKMPFECVIVEGSKTFQWEIRTLNKSRKTGFYASYRLFGVHLCEA